MHGHFNIKLIIFTRTISDKGLPLPHVTHTHTQARIDRVHHTLTTLRTVALIERIQTRRCAHCNKCRNAVCRGCGLRALETRARVSEISSYTHAAAADQCLLCTAQESCVDRQPSIARRRRRRRQLEHADARDAPNAHQMSRRRSGGGRLVGTHAQRTYARLHTHANMKIPWCTDDHTTTARGIFITNVSSAAVYTRTHTR